MKRASVRLGAWSTVVSFATFAALLAAGCRDGSTPESRALNPGDEALQSAAAPDGKTVFLAGDGGLLRALDVATGRIRAFASGAKACVTPALSPDGKTLAVACSNGGQRYEIRLFDVASGTRRVVPSPKADLFPAWSEDGRRLYFLRAARTQDDGFGLPASDFRIMVRDMGTGTTRVAGTDTFLDAQGLAATAKGVVISGSDPVDSTKKVVVEYEATRGGLTRLSSRSIDASKLRMAVDGTLLAIGDPKGDYGYEVCRVPESGPLVPVTSLKTYVESFDPLRDGALIVLHSPTRDHRYRLTRIDRYGRERPIFVRPRR